MGRAEITYQAIVAIRLGLRRYRSTIAQGDLAQVLPTLVSANWHVVLTSRTAYSGMSLLEATDRTTLRQVVR